MVEVRWKVNLSFLLNCSERRKVAGESKSPPGSSPSLGCFLQEAAVWQLLLSLARRVLKAEAALSLPLLYSLELLCKSTGLLASLVGDMTAGWRILLGHRKGFVSWPDE